MKKHIAFYLLIASLQTPVFCAEETSPLKPSISFECNDQRKHHDYAYTTLDFIHFPKNQELKIHISRPLLSQERIPFNAIKIVDNGTLFDQEKKPLKALTLSSAGYLPAEKVTLDIISAGEDFSHTTTVMPNPVSCLNKARGIGVEAELISIDPTTYQLHITGITKGTEVHLSYLGTVDIYKTKFIYDPLVPITIQPTGKGRKGGTIIVTLRTVKRGGVKIRLPWGERVTYFQNKERHYVPL